MIYPNSFERKIGFNDIRGLLRSHCLSNLGKEQVDGIVFSTDVAEVNRWLDEIREWRRLEDEHSEVPLNFFFDIRESLKRIRLEGTHFEEDEVWDLRRSLETVCSLVALLNADVEEGSDGSVRYPYPALQHLTDGVITFPAMLRRIDSILDKFGKIKDSASMTLAGIRHDLQTTEGSISRTLYTILHAAQREGLVDKDVTPSVRDGRLVIPVAPGVKRRISGIVHDESATGKTVFIEPTEVVEANNKVRELEAAERREVIRILTVFTDEVRPHVNELLYSYLFLAKVDMIQAKARFAADAGCFEPVVRDESCLDWIRAVHPLLHSSLQKQNKQVVPLDIRLGQVRSEYAGHEKGEKGDVNGGKRDDVCGCLLIISGPNAGGKSVCLKTVGLLQYMLQCGLSIPIGDRSVCGMFHDIMIDIGDEQSIEDDLSTYSSHLVNMKQMMRQANDRTLLLIDEFGGGTEPAIGGAIAEAVLKQFWVKGANGVITTHYHNLKHFADDHAGVVNGAMLYDRHQMQPLFQLSIGQPGSSFAIEIARKTGLPEEVIQDASDIVGAEYIQSDKYLQDIVRDKRYWEGKRQSIHQHEKRLEVRGEKLDATIEQIERERKEILLRAKEQAEELLRSANRKIENTIREIREQQAEKEAARRAREELKAFKDEVADIGSQDDDELIARKIRQIQERKERRRQRKEENKARSGEQGHIGGNSSAAGGSLAQHAASAPQLKAGSTVRIKGLTSVGEIESTDGKMAVVVFGGMKTKIRLERLEYAEASKPEQTRAEERNASIVGAYGHASSETRQVIDSRRNSFSQDIDVRGMRGDEAINAVTYFIDDAILVGVARVRILHGTGSGILRQLIRQYLATVPNVSHFRDEHVQFGGAGITVVDLY